MTLPLVTVAIPVLNGIHFLPTLLERLRAQRGPFRIEVVASDSGSTDGSRVCLDTQCDKVLHLQSQSFNHGATRNHLIEAGRGELIALLVQDALPQDDRWLDRLTAQLWDDASIVGTFGRQIPRADASPWTRRYLEKWAAGRCGDRRIALTAETYGLMSPGERLDACAFDNVSSCLRRSVWRQIPFPVCDIAEDIAWAKSVLLAGHTLSYVSAAVVVHSHDRNGWYEFRRAAMLHRELRRLFDLRLAPTAVDALMGAVASMRQHHQWLLEDGPGSHGWIYDIWRAYSTAVAQPFGQYLGGSRLPLCRFDV